MKMLYVGGGGLCEPQLFASSKYSTCCNGNTTRCNVKVLPGLFLSRL